MIIVTGATGFIGSNLLFYLRERRNNVMALQRDLFKASELEQISFFRENKVKCLIHLAASGVSGANSFETEIQFNFLDSFQLIDSAYKSGCRNFQIAGSCFEYGRTGNDIAFLEPGDQLDPVGNHAISKATHFLNLERKFRNAEINMKYLRLFQVYGDNENESRLYPSLLKAAKAGENFAMSSGKQIRDFIHVKEVCKAINYSIDSTIGWRVENICTGNPLSVFEFASHHWNLVGARGKLQPGAIDQKQSQLNRLVGKAQPKI